MEAPSGATAAFKRYLNDLAPTTYNLGGKTPRETIVKEGIDFAASASEWPDVYIKHESENITPGRLASAVRSTPGSMGYAPLPDVRGSFSTGEAGEVEEVMKGKGGK